MTSQCYGNVLNDKFINQWQTHLKTFTGLNVPHSCHELADSPFMNKFPVRNSDTSLNKINLRG